MKRIYARNTRVENISNDKLLVKQFLTDNHLQGNCRNNTIVYGLYYNQELVQLMSFGKPRFDYKNYSYEIIRECSKKGYQIIGGSSRLFKRFMKDNSTTKSICVYTDFNFEHELKNSDHYVKHLGFKMDKPAKAGTREVFVSNYWPRNDKYGKSYSKSIIARQGPDRILGTNLGNTHGSNFDIMLSLDYHIEVEDYISPQKDIWYSGGYTYKTTHIPSGKFYVGMSERMDDYSKRTYLGSGVILGNYLNKYPITDFHKEIIETFDRPHLLRKAEAKLIEESIKDSNCLNVKNGEQGSHVCDECRKDWTHAKGCSKRKKCTECLGEANRHRKGCSLGNNICKECKAWVGHTKECSKHTPHKACPECGSQRQHRRGCSKYKKPKGCPECGSASSHLKICSKFKPTICEECGARSGKHHKECSKYEEFKGCKECENKSTHKPSCSKYRRKLCDECGSSPHKKVCSKWKPSKPVSLCPGCGTKYHTKTCPIKPRGAKSTSSVE